jgi:hypothetical protein
MSVVIGRTGFGTQWPYARYLMQGGVMKCGKTLLCLFVGMLPLPSVAAPTCVTPDAHNFVFGRLVEGRGGDWWLQNVATSDRIFLRRCSARGKCYYAVDVKPGRYYLKEMVPGSTNQFKYPVSRSGLWFEISGGGVDYIGDWSIERDDTRTIKKLDVKYSLKSLDSMADLCRISDRKEFLDQIRQPSAEIVN